MVMQKANTLGLNFLRAALFIAKNVQCLQFLAHFNGGGDIYVVL